MNVYLLRHAKAEKRSEEIYPNDAERPTTAEGIKKLAAALKGLKKLKPDFKELWTSPFVRTRQTAEAAAKAFGCPLKDEPLLTPGTSPYPLIKILSEMEADSILLVGHENHLSRFLGLCIGIPNPGEGLMLKKSGAACIRFDEKVSPGTGRLLWLMGPKELATLALRQKKI